MIASPPPDLWTLDAFVAAVNAALPEVLPSSPVVRIERTVTPRLVRYLATQGVVSEPHRAGREARYDRRHLIELLAVRRLMALGHTVAAVGTTVRAASDPNVEAMLAGDVGLSPTSSATMLDQARLEEPVLMASMDLPGSDALDFLASLSPEGGIASSLGPDIQRRMSGELSRAPGFKPSRRPGALPDRWRRTDLAPGVELHVREDATLPSGPADRDRLVRSLLAFLDSLAHDRHRTR